ncbi:hypothetical protein [Williamsoniiplasma luminosum]|uniref:Uncharacterized protein n=1 Tax=Williamsoniiplasma luminosum TaxID=214888 RepID=A0A2S0NKW9_9MOLU|nr:hypothetical protein [Williamsoniiplasma luminosum]AVP49660.1 MAG: hypothetical protein C5T88_03740 [Williamsoniiplasma luminosum]
MDTILANFENEEFNLYIDDVEQVRAGKFKNIKWKEQQIKMFRLLQSIEQDMWIQIYDVFLDKQKNVVKIGFRLTPEASFYHEYPMVDFDVKGNITTDLKKELKTLNPKALKLCKNFYDVLGQVNH